MTNPFLHFLQQIPTLDFFALCLFLALWAGYAFYADSRHKKSASLIEVMDRYRHAWMRQMLKRDNRMVDAAMMGNLMRSIAFFANTSIFILFGLFTTLGYRDQAESIIQSIPFAAQTSELVWELKILLLAVIFIYAFFKYTWSLRQYNYASIFVAAAPLPQEQRPWHDDIAERGAKLITNAARHFNMGLRAYYFGLAALAWFIHPLAFIAATWWVIYVVYRREFLSHTLTYLAKSEVIREEEPAADA